MKTYKILLGFILLSVTAFTVNAQDSVRFNIHKNELNIGYFNVFQLDAVPSFGIGYKLRTENGAFRLRANFSTRNSKAEIDSGSERTRTSYSIQPQIGYEWQEDFGRLLLYYGADLSAGYYKSTYRVENLIDPVDLYTNNSESIRLSINPIIGLKVFINSSISVSTETFFYVSYTMNKSKTINGTEVTNSKDTALNTGLSPLGVFSINFHF